MELTNEQRAWLDKAIQQKGRFTTKKAVKNQLKDYISRRGKTAVALAGLATDHPQYKTIQDGLNAADEFAKKGDLKSAYNTLNNIKAIAKGAAAGRASQIQVDAIRRDTAALSSDAGIAVEAKRAAFAIFHDLVAVIKAAPKASDLKTFEEALAFRTNFVAKETNYRGIRQDADTQCRAAQSQILAFNIAPRLATLLMDISALKSAGHAKEMADYEAKCLQIKKVFESDDRLKDPTSIGNYVNNKQNVHDFETAILACKSLAKWQRRDTDNSAKDAKTDTIRGGLTPNDDARLAVIKAEEERLERARAEIKLNASIDTLVLMDTDTGQITITPKPAKFDPGETLDGLAGGVVLGAEIDEGRADAIAAEAAKRIRDFLKNAATDKDKLFDLSVKKRSELLSMIALEALGTTNPDDWTESQKAMLDKAVAAIVKAICQNLPNQLSGDGSKISVGGKEYKNPVLLKQGGNGKATLYTDDNGKSIVVKTLISSDEEDQEGMIWEMQTHYRAMQGAEDDSAIIGFHGAARSENGQMHMILEAVDGGDMEDRNNALSAAASAGLISDQARQAIALNDLLKTVKALKELEKQGLVHRDIKGENVMMTKDGKIKIIDLGESDFVDDTGVIAAGNSKGSTKGYEAEEVVRSREHNTKADLVAISGMLQRMVADMRPKEDLGKAKMETGSLGRLVAALSDPDPKNRPSLDAILQSTMAKSYEDDFNPEDLKDLQDAALDFTFQMASVKGTINVDDLKSKVSVKTGKALKSPMKARELQDMIAYLEQDIATLLREFKKNPKQYLTGGTSNGKEKLEALQKDVAVLKGQAIQPMVDAAVEGGKTRYKDALKDPSIIVEVAIGSAKKKMTVGKAVEAREQLNTRMMESRARVMETLSSMQESQELQVKIDAYNDAITRMFEAIKAIDKVIYAAVGPEAKFYLAKVKMDKASAAFGPVGKPASEKGVEDKSGLEELVTRIAKEDIHDEIKTNATN